MKALTDTIAAFKLVWLRVACYFVIPFFTTFLALTETWSDKTWHETGWFLIFRMAVSCFVAGITSLVAFIDSSFQRAKQEGDYLKQKREAQTDFAARTEAAKHQPENG